MFNNYLPSLVRELREEEKNLELDPTNPNLTTKLIIEHGENWVFFDLSKNPNLTKEIIGKYEHHWYWSLLSRYLVLTPELVEKYKRKWDWKQLSMNLSLNAEIIRKYKFYLDLDALFGNSAFSWELIEEFISDWDLNNGFREPNHWDLISKNPNIALSFIQTHGEYLDWGALSRNLKLTSKTFEVLKSFEKEWSFSWLSSNPSLMPDIIEYYENKWKEDRRSKFDYFITENHHNKQPPKFKISLLRFHRFSRKLRRGYGSLKLHKHLVPKSPSESDEEYERPRVFDTPLFDCNLFSEDDESIQNHENKTPLNSEISELAKNIFHRLMEAVMELDLGKDTEPEYSDIDDFYDSNDYRNPNSDDSDYSSDGSFHEGYNHVVRTYERAGHNGFTLYWEWKDLSRNPNLTFETIDRYRRRWDWTLLSSNSCLTPKIIKKFAKKLDWKLLSANTSFTPDLFGIYEDKISWKELSLNPNLTPEIIKKYKERLNPSFLVQNRFNLHPIIFQRNKKKYIDAIKHEIQIYFYARERRKYESVLDMVRLRIRDIKVGVRSRMF